MKVETIVDITDRVLNPNKIRISQVDGLTYRFNTEFCFLQVHRWLFDNEMTFDIRFLSIYTEDKEVGSAGMETVMQLCFEKEEEALMFKLRWM